MDPETQMRFELMKLLLARGEPAEQAIAAAREAMFYIIKGHVPASEPVLYRAS